MKSHQLFRRACGICWVAAALGACRGSVAGPGGGTITGPVVSVILPESADQLPSVHVKSSSTDPCGIVFQVSGATVIVRRVGTREESASLMEIALGQKVSVWAASMILESCPAHSSAARIVLLP